MTDSQITSYANFNAVQITARISNVDELTGKNGAFIAVTLISNLMKDDDGCTVKFLASDGLMALHQKGFLPVGRLVTVSGHLSKVTETYTNKDGELMMLKRPQIELTDVTIPTGGLGPMPRSEDAPKRRVGAVVKPAQAAAKAEAPAVDGTPVF